jgi:hypothetical protein
LKDLESHILRQLLSTAGAHGRYSQKRWEIQKVGNTSRIGSDRADGGQDVLETDVEPTFHPGYSFRPRSCKGRSSVVCFTAAVSKSAIKAMRATIRGWKLQLWSSSSLEDIARQINPEIRGWLNYYGRCYGSVMHPIPRQLQYALVRWAMGKYKRLRGHWLWQLTG